MYNYHVNVVSWFFCFIVNKDHYYILEPETCVTDCWAQGSVPKHNQSSSAASTPRESTIEEEPIENIVDTSRPQTQ